MSRVNIVCILKVIAAYARPFWRYRDLYTRFFANRTAPCRRLQAPSDII
jgi:hypothetical protein